MRVDFSGSCSGRLSLNISERSIAVILMVVVVAVVVAVAVAVGVKDVGEGEAGIREGACLDHGNE